MIKKIVSILFILLMLCSCNTVKPDFNSGFSIETYKCDMSHYKGVNSVNHSFVGTTVKELNKTIIEKGYGAFVLSRESCEHCQMVMQLIDKAATDLGVTVYYIDGESDIYPIVNTPDYDLLDSLLKPIEEPDDEGEIYLQTPHFFTVVDGKFQESILGFDIKGDEPTDKEKQNQMSKYKNALKIFVK